MKSIRLVCSLLLLTILSLEKLNAQSDSTITCDARVIKATTATQPSIAPELTDIKGKLTKPPFSSFNCFALTKHTTSLITKGKLPVKIILDGGAIMTVKYNSSTNTSGKSRYSFSYTIVDSTGKTTQSSSFSVDKGDSIIISAGQINGNYSFVALKFT